MKESTTIILSQSASIQIDISTNMKNERENEDFYKTNRKMYCK